MWGDFCTLIKERRHDESSAFLQPTYFEMVNMSTINISVFGRLHFDEENACRTLVLALHYALFLHKYQSKQILSSALTRICWDVAKDIVH